MQLDSDGKVRKVWLFEFKVHLEPDVVPITLDAIISSQVIVASRAAEGDHSDDEIVAMDNQDQAEQGQVEQVRSKLLLMEPRKFEYFVKDLLVHSGFTEVCVTKYSADGGVDVNARVGGGIWMFESTLVQVQAKRWLHSVGRLQGFGSGAYSSSVCTIACASASLHCDA